MNHQIDKPKRAVASEIRWMVRKDMPAVLQIESECFFEHSWTEAEFIRCLRQRSCIGMVADVGDDVAGFMIYELCASRFHLLNFGVAPRYRRRGVGRAMVQKLIGKMEGGYPRNQILLEVRETNLDAQLFFKAFGFRAISVLSDFYEDSAEDAYLMQYLFRQAEHG
jgi:[ribosomal protein S18]-alanine N-acetyltransferase